MKKNTTLKITGRDRDPATVDLEWLLSRGRNGRPRIETLGWKRLAAIYESHAPGSVVRRAVNAEARRCGYTPRAILALNAGE